MKVTGHVEISYRQVDNNIYQRITIKPNKAKNLKYFINDKFSLGRKVERFLDKRYIGDGNNILFMENNRYKNQQTIKYQVLTPGFEVDLSSKKFFIEGEIPAKENCTFCQYRAEVTGTSQIRCMYYRKMLKIKASCIDFCE